MKKTVYISLLCFLAATITNSICLGIREQDSIYLGSFLKPWEFGDPHELIAFEFEDAELTSLIKYIEHRYDITFIMDNALNPLPKGGKSAVGSKISFKTEEPLSKKEAWSIFLTFLDMSGLTVTPGPGPKIFKITSIDPKSEISAPHQPLPTFIGIHPDLIPDNDTYIRYVYFVKNANLDVIKSVLDKFKSPQSPNLIIFPEVRGIIVTDKAFNIKTMLELVNELDTVTMPETVSVLKLKRTDATKVAKLYQELTQTPGQGTLASRILGSKQPQTLSYFDPSTRVIPYATGNTLILIGTEDSVKKIETFISNQIDKEITKPYSPMHVYSLKYVQAEAVANILNKAVKFQSGSDAAKSGGVRDGDKYFKPISIVPEKSGNRLIITGEYEDYLKIREMIEKIDIEQPQVALKVLIVNVDITDTKEIGSQIRSKKPGVSGLLGDNVNYQTSGLAGSSTAVENPNGTGAQRLLGDLISLATGGSIGSTYLTMGADCFGIWGMFRILDSYTNTNIMSNPFVVTKNNYPAEVGLGEKRRVLAGVTTGAGGSTTNSFTNLEAKLTVSITPQISYEGFITLDIIVQDNQFTNPGTQSGDRTEKEVRTSVILANNEVLALGGTVKNTYSETESKVPILGDIPLVGWLFKNKNKTKIKTSLLILISPEIIPANDTSVIDEFTATQLTDSQGTLSATDSKAKSIDPVHRWFFKDALDGGTEMMQEFISKEEEYLHPTQKQKRAKSTPKRKRLSDFL